MSGQQTQADTKSAAVRSATVYSILFAISSVHLLNDSMQAVVSALFPIFEDSLNLNYSQIGWIAFTLNMTSSVMQPVVGLVSDRKPMPWMLPLGMLCSMAGMAGLAFAPNFWLLLLSVVFVGLGSAVFHPEGSRVVHMGAGNRRAFAQSIYQVGGNFGSTLAPLMTIFIFVPLGQRGAAWGMLLAAAAIAVLFKVVPWYSAQLAAHADQLPKKRGGSAAGGTGFAPISQRTVAFALTILFVVVFARSWYAAGIGTFYQFYAEEQYGLSTKGAQVPLFLFMAAGVIGTFFGGMVADRIGRKKMMLISLLGAAPIALILPHLPLGWVYPVIAVLGLVLQSGFSVSVVYAQDLMPNKVGTASGLITGLAFGMGALGSVVLGHFAVVYSLEEVIVASSALLVLGLLALLLPKDRK
ncbi:MFS transporter [Paenibacillus harenae]|uniref:FSR family fosmidomycin resistance protein-like MFS transporter n=1 Tax=Paenibacillus harenae TaxID=306543 RepID=A0ABT9U0U0_PAEHA|nr:MFS transporter [Paenibacillus harenae]MDQ0060436.1 FSR family fosmidomycin resistance protein-like MFS transporter [Paenibacillus harenae]MDQ0112049.1 FSR family fosmidomycin resistance protein-like MFS transporter [Paenibacillus harenae]